jgi:hypothetical protein
VKALSLTFAFMALLAAGCASSNVSNLQSQLPVEYHDGKYGLTFWLPADWLGFSVLREEWHASMSPEHGPMIVLRHPQWRTNSPYQDIPIMVFTRNQWTAKNSDYGFYIGAGGIEYEISHNNDYVFGISSRFNWADTVTGSEEAGDAVQKNSAAHEPHLYAE